MRNLKVLLKYDLLKLVNFFRGKKREKSIYAGIFALVFAGLGIFALYTAQAWSMYFGLAPLGLSKVCLFHGFMVAFMVLVIFAIMRSAAAKKHGDSDLLMSLPLRKSEIILSKTFTKYLMDFALVFVAIIPFLILYQVYEGFNIFVLLSGLILTLLLPLFSIGLSYIFNFIIARVFNRTRYSSMLKSLTATILMIAVLALLFTKTFGYGTVNPMGLSEYFADRPITSQLLYFTLNQGFLPKLYVILLCVVPFILGLCLFAKNFGREEVGYASKSTALNFKASKNGFLRFFKKEVSFYFSTPAYVTNTLIGPILMLGVAVLIPVLGVEKVLGFVESKELLAGIVAVIVCTLAGMTFISSSSISLEGKQFWILKSSPVNVDTIFMAKALLNFVIIAIPAVISIAVLSLVLSLGFAYFAQILALAITFAVVISVGGLVLNLLYPKLDFKDETQVIKQSMASGLSLLGGMLLGLLPIVLYLLCRDFLSIQLMLSIMIVLYSLLALALVFILKHKGERWFSRIG